ncbi:MAG TPA: AbrB/MazE/SpoVT family DNA-binding domain-containing protein [Vicinamibacterales bacterium]
MKRSLVQTGSSLAVTLPMEVVQAFNLRKGQEVEVSVHPLTGAVTIRPGIARVEGGQVTATFRSLADSVLARRAGALRRLKA